MSLQPVRSLRSFIPSVIERSGLDMDVTFVEFHGGAAIVRVRAATTESASLAARGRPGLAESVLDVLSFELVAGGAVFRVAESVGPGGALSGVVDLIFADVPDDVAGPFELRSPLASAVFTD